MTRSDKYTAMWACIVLGNMYGLAGKWPVFVFAAAAVFFYWTWRRST